MPELSEAAKKIGDEPAFPIPSETIADAVTGKLARCRYRGMTYRQWLIGQIAPSVQFPPSVTGRSDEAAVAIEKADCVLNALAAEQEADDER